MRFKDKKNHRLFPSASLLNRPSCELDKDGKGELIAAVIALVGQQMSNAIGFSVRIGDNTARFDFESGVHGEPSHQFFDFFVCYCQIPFSVFL